MWVAVPRLYPSFRGAWRSGERQEVNGLCNVRKIMPWELASQESWDEDGRWSHVQANAEEHFPAPRVDS